MNRFWGYDIIKNSFVPRQDESLSVFPTIINIKQKTVFCRQHKRWENIAAFQQNVLKTACGKLYTGPFTQDETIFNYNYVVSKKEGNWYIKVNSQTVSTKNRRLLENIYEVNTKRKRLFKNGTPIFERKDLTGVLCKEITSEILRDMGAAYKEKFGICPTVASKLGGLSVILGYMLSPFNINFYRIAQHWGLNPYDPDFAALSSGNTPTAENEMFDSMGIKPTKTLRKLYQKFPQSVICYAAAQDMGFTDVNLLQKSPAPSFYAFLKYFMISFAGGQITYIIREPLKQFVRDMLALSNQKTVWNSIERTVGFFANHTVSPIIITDAINMYYVCSRHLTNQEKKEVMREGFNQYTHDFFLRRQEQLNLEGLISSHKVEANVPFTIEPEFMALEYKAGRQFRENPVTKELEEVPDKERFCFYVAKDSYTLKQIGSAMSNCVGWGYKNAVLERRATIVYAMFQNKYRICIEVTPDFSIRQALGPHNTQLCDDALQAFFEWCDKKDIKRPHAFGQIHVAPHG